jgi:hypothetical protein
MPTWLSSGLEWEAARWPGRCGTAAQGCCSSSAEASCRANPRIGARRQFSARTDTRPTSSGAMRAPVGSRPVFITSWVGIPRSMVRRCHDYVERISARFSTRAVCRQPGPFPTRIWLRTTIGQSAGSGFTARQGLTRLILRAPVHSRFRRCRPIRTWRS